MNLLLFLIIGLAAGWIAGQIMKGGGFGLIGDLIVGVIGSFIGGHILGWLNVWTGSGLIGSLVTAVIGALVLLLIIRLIKRA
jgi:uncharacterized membrane protein YeaQ/YmgE (transglycosylase-associated protein family)